MYIEINIIPTRIFHTTKNFKHEMTDVFENLRAAILSQCMTNKDYAIGSGCVLDSNAQVVATYEIRKYKNKPAVTVCDNLSSLADDGEAQAAALSEVDR